MAVESSAYDFKETVGANCYEDGTMREKYEGNARDAHLHMLFIFVTCPTFHCDRSPLNELALETVAEVARK